MLVRWMDKQCRRAGKDTLSSMHGPNLLSLRRHCSLPMPQTACLTLGQKACERIAQESQGPKCGAQKDTGPGRHSVAKTCKDIAVSTAAHKRCNDDVANVALRTCQVQQPRCKEVDGQQMHEQRCCSDWAREQPHYALQVWEELGLEPTWQATKCT